MANRIPREKFLRRKKKKNQPFAWHSANSARDRAYPFHWYEFWTHGRNIHVVKLNDVHTRTGNTNTDIATKHTQTYRMSAKMACKLTMTRNARNRPASLSLYCRGPWTRLQMNGAGRGRAVIQSSNSRPFRHFSGTPELFTDSIRDRPRPALPFPRGSTRSYPSPRSPLTADRWRHHPSLVFLLMFNPVKEARL